MKLSGLTKVEGPSSHTKSQQQSQSYFDRNIVAKGYFTTITTLLLSVDRYHLTILQSQFSENTRLNLWGEKYFLTREYFCTRQGGMLEYDFIEIFTG